MNARRNILAVSSLALMLISCKGADTGLLVDYKRDRYKISVGGNYKTSDRIIGWSWAAENDPDGVIDPEGKDAFMFLGEPLISYNGGEWLPALYIETDKDIITSFTCSVIFVLADRADAGTAFLSRLSKDIKQLENSEVIKSLINKGIYKKHTQGYVEIFRLIKGLENEYDRFEYMVTLSLRALASADKVRFDKSVYKQKDT